MRFFVIAQCVVQLADMYPFAGVALGIVGLAVAHYFIVVVALVFLNIDPLLLDRVEV